MNDTRDDFEAHFKPTIRQQKRHTDGSYRDPLTQARWEGYQAAIASDARKVKHADGGIYSHFGKARPAGKAKADIVTALDFYRGEDGQMWFRYPDDLAERMTPVNA